MAGHSLNTAALVLGKSVSFFSGENSMLARYRRGGVAALLPQRGATGAKPTFTVPDWFVPAANHFYLLSNRTWDRGSVPEAVMRVISLPALPVGWKNSDRARFLKKLNLAEPPVCPPELRELILARQKAGRELVPERLRRLITVNPVAVRQYRNPREAALDLLNAPGGMRLFPDAETGELRLARAGEIIEADDATINFPVCVPWSRDGSDDPCVRKYGVKVARFQWLVTVDVGTGFVTGFSYTARPSSSYRAEDIVSLMRTTVRAHGIPKRWRFERGSWESKLVTEAARLMGSQLENVHSPHMKPFIEGLFNVLWTKLSVQFPGAHVGRFRGEEREASALLEACRTGAKDPRRHFPMLATAIAAFHEVIAEKNRTPVTSASHGRWIPEERWEAELNLPGLDAASDWMFAPWIREWKVKGMIVGGRVPVFEDLSVPFDFSANWLVKWHGAKVRCHFDPADPRCGAMLVLAEPFMGHRAGIVLGAANQINQTGSYVRLVMGWGDDPDTAGLKARQHAAGALRREVRAVMPHGAKGDSVSEERDGIGRNAKIESGSQPSSAEAAKQETPAPDRTEEIAQRARQAEEHFAANPLDFV